MMNVHYIKKNIRCSYFFFHHKKFLEDDVEKKEDNFVSDLLCKMIEKKCNIKLDK